MNWCFWTVVLEKTLESPLDWKGIQPIHSRGNQSWIFIGRTDTETLNTLATSWCWERLKAGEGDDRGWDGWMASLTRWTWVLSGSWRWTGKPGVLQSMGSQTVTWLSDWTELNWWLLMCLFKIALVDASLKWIFCQSKFKSGTYITKKKKKLSWLKLEYLII